MSDIELFPDDESPPTQALHSAIAAGMPLATGLRMYAQEYPPRARTGLLAMADAIESGAPLAQAVEASRGTVPVYLAGLIDGGIRSNCVGTMLEEYLHQRRLQKRFGQKVALDLVYPFVVMFFTALICFLILIWLVPMFTSIYEDFGVELPSLTLLLINLSKAALFLAYPVTLVFAVVGGGLLLFVFGGRWSKAVVDRIPFFGSSARYASMSEFCSLLAPLVETAIPMTQALPAVAATMLPSRLKRRVQDLSENYDGCFELADVARSRKLPSEICHLLTWEQRGTAFNEILRSWAELFAKMASGRSSVITAILAPILMIGIGVFIGMLVIALFLPLIKLLNELS